MNELQGYFVTSKSDSDSKSILILPYQLHVKKKCCHCYTKESLLTPTDQPTHQKLQWRLTNELSVPLRLLFDMGLKLSVQGQHLNGGGV